MPKFYMLIGVPASGKSTWLKQNIRGDVAVASSDDYIEHEAKKAGKTYNDVFADTVKAGNQWAINTAKAAFAQGKDVVWDQTNLTKKSRAPKLALVPEEYEKIAVFFPTPHPYIHRKRLDSRPGKKIPDHIVGGMAATMEPPSKDEGFHEIITV